MKNKSKTTLKVGVAQVAPIRLDRNATVARVIDWIRDAASRDCKLMVFGEAQVPGYPFRVERTDGGLNCWSTGAASRQPSSRTSL